jgi:hypothetical protein
VNVIHNILHNNSFPISPQKHNPPHQPAKQTTPKQKSATFTYVGRETSYITNIFRHTELKISFRTTNTLNNLLTHKHKTQGKFSLSGVYKLICPDCKKTYVGQTGRSSQHATMNIKQPFATIATLQASLNTSPKKPTHSAQ